MRKPELSYNFEARQCQKQISVLLDGLSLRKCYARDLTFPGFELFGQDGGTYQKKICFDQADTHLRDTKVNSERSIMIPKLFLMDMEQHFFIDF